MDILYNDLPFCKRPETGAANICYNDPMHWLIFAGISVLTFAVASLFQRLAMKEEKSDPVTSSIIFQLLLGLGSTIIALIVGFHPPPAYLWPYFLAAGFLYAFGSLFFFRAIKTIGASELAILGGAGTLVTLIVSFVFLSERLSPTQWLGAVFILTAIVIVNYERESFRFHKGVLLALAGTSCYGLAIVFDGYILRTVDAISYLPLSSFLPALVLILIFPKKIPALIQNIRQINVNLGIYSALYVISAEAFYTPIQNGALVSQVSSVGRVSIILTVILAMIFLKERSHVGKKVVGAILTTVGILLIR